MASTNIQTGYDYAALMRVQTFWWLLALIGFFSFLFAHSPDIDLLISRLFYDDGFRVAQEPVWRSVRRLSINFTKVLGALLIVMLALRLFTPIKAPLFPIAKLAYPTVCFIVGPGLLTNTLLKDNWGRARPRHLEEFGGEAIFSGPWEIVEECARNCSFVSGETSAALWLITLIPLLPIAWHKRTLCFVGIYTVLVSVLRIAFGGHFLSDVIFSILLNGLIFWLLWGCFFSRRRPFKPHDWVTENHIVHFLPLQQYGGTFFSALKLAYFKIMNKVRRNK